MYPRLSATIRPYINLYIRRSDFLTLLGQVAAVKRPPLGSLGFWTRYRQGSFEGKDITIYLLINISKYGVSKVCPVSSYECMGKHSLWPKYKEDGKTPYDTKVRNADPCNLKGFENRDVILSGGQQQKGSHSGALVSLNESLYWMNLGALDLKLRKGMQIELKNIQQKLGITFICYPRSGRGSYHVRYHCSHEPRVINR